MDDLMRSFLGPRARLTRPVLPLFLPKPFVPVTDVFVRDEAITNHPGPVRQCDQPVLHAQLANGERRKEPRESVKSGLKHGLGPQGLERVS